MGEALARGGMGAVYRVEQLSNGKPRALKVLHPELARDARFREKFAQEARVGARLTSAHVVEVSDAGIDDATGIPWLAMELLQGELVSAYVTPKLPLAAGDAWEILAPLGDALGAAHDVGVIHLDLKPENLFMARVAMRGVTRPVLKVLDFGIARVVLEGRTSAEVTTAAGSPLWMAPEQAMEGGRVRSSSDVWSVGLLAFWLLTGKKYWREANAPRPVLRKLFAEVLFQPVVAASERARELGVEGRLPPGFDLWFRHSVERDPDARFQHARAAFNALERTLFPMTVADAEVLPDTVPRGVASMLAQGDLAGARASLGHVIAGEGAPAEVWATRGECDLRLGRWDDAVADFSAAIERAPSVGAYWYGRSVALAALGQGALARTDLVQAAALGHAPARARLTGG